MTQQDYQNLIETYGVHPSRWPEDIRATAMNFAYKYPEDATRMNANTAFLDKIMDAAQLADTDNALLTARILKATTTIGQKPRQRIDTPANDHPTKFLPDDVKLAPMARWKYLAATLFVTMGIGFGIGQGATARSDYWVAESLYAYNMDTESATSEWLEVQE